MCFLYNEVKENKEYILVDIKEIVKSEFEKNLDSDILKEGVNILNKQMQYDIDHLNKEEIKEIAVRKDSKIGRYVLENGRNKAHYISHKAVTNAYLISVAQNEEKLSNKLMHLFKGRVEGWYDELTNVPARILEYITDNNDYELYLSKLDGNYHRKYYIYENDTIENKELSSVKKYMKK